MHVLHGLVFIHGFVSRECLVLAHDHDWEVKSQGAVRGRLEEDVEDERVVWDHAHDDGVEPEKGVRMEHHRQLFRVHLENASVLLAVVYKRKAGLSEFLTIKKHYKKEDKTGVGDYFERG